MAVKLLWRELRETAPVECLMAVLYPILGLLVLMPTRGSEFTDSINALLIGGAEAYLRLVYPNQIFQLLTYTYLFAVLGLSARRFHRDLFGSEIFPSRAVPVGAGVHIAVKACTAVLWLTVALAMLTFCIRMSFPLQLHLNSFAGISSPYESFSLLPGLLLLLAVLYYWITIFPLWKQKLRKLRAGLLLVAIDLSAFVAVIFLSALVLPSDASEQTLRLIRLPLSLVASVLFFALASRRMKRVFAF